MESVVNSIIKEKIIVIMRGIDITNILETAKAVVKGGIKLLEVTFDAKADPHITAEAIYMLNTYFGDKILIGAGTVMTSEQVDIAYKAGAKYILSPNFNKSVIKKTKKHGLVSIPGAFTPSEIAEAYSEGADFVKLFPAASLGTSYLKAVKAPLSNIPFIAVGGIDHTNMASFLDCGAKAVGVGSCLINDLLIKQGRFDEITKMARLYTGVTEKVGELV